MVDFTKTAADILTAAGLTFVDAGDLATHLEEMAAAVDAAPRRKPVAGAASVSLTAADGFQIYSFTDAASVALPEVGTLPAGWHVRLKASAGGDVTVTPFSGDTVEGLAELVVGATEVVELYADPTGNWVVVRIAGLGSLGTAATRNVGTSEDNVVALLAGGKLPAVNGENLVGAGGRVPLELVTGSDIAALEVRNLNPTRFMGYELLFQIRPASANAVPLLQVSGDNGLNWDNGAAEYAWNAAEGNRTGDITEGGATSASNMQMTVNAVTTAGAGISGQLTVLFPDDVAATQVRGGYCGDLTTGFGLVDFAGTRLAAKAVNAFRIRANGTNLTGKIQVVGLVRSS